jgi:hypothetical protein
MANAQIDVVSKGSSLGLPKSLVKYGLIFGAIGLGGYLLFKNAGGIASFVGNAAGSLFGGIGSSIQGGIDNFVNNINKSLNGVTGNGTIQGNPQGGDTVYKLTGANGSTSVVKAGTPSTDPTLNLIDPNTLKPINLGDFQNNFPSLYAALGTIKLPSSYQSDYVAGRTNEQPAAFGNTEGLSNTDIFNLNVALGANPDTGEFDVSGVKYYVAGSGPFSLTPAEIQYDQTHGIRIVKA